MCTFYSFPILTSVGGHLSWFHFLAIVNSVAIDKDIQVYLQ